MKISKPNGEQPQINLKQHQRFKRVIPWSLIRKAVLALILGGLIYYLMNALPKNEPIENPETGIEIEIEES